MGNSARNHIEGVVKGVEVGDVLASVKVEIGTGEVITAVITRESVNDLGIEEGKKVKAMVKATSVMIEED